MTWILLFTLGVIIAGARWVRSLPVQTIRARVYRASAEERATPQALMAALYADPTYVRRGVWENDRIVSRSIVWPWKAGSARNVVRAT